MSGWLCRNKEYRLHRRYIRDAADPFDKWRQDEFKRRYHFKKEVVLHIILPLIEDQFYKQQGIAYPYSSSIVLFSTILCDWIIPGNYYFYLLIILI